MAPSIKEQPQNSSSSSTSTSPTTTTTTTSSMMMSSSTGGSRSGKGGTVAAAAKAAAAERGNSNVSSTSNKNTTNTNATNTNTTTTSIGTKPTLIDQVKPMRFLIMDAPRQANLHLYIKEMRKHHVSHVVRVCEPTYHAGGELSNAGIELHEMEYKDGTSPSKELIFAWLKLVEDTFYASSPASANTSSSSASPEKSNAANNNNTCIAVHCVAGLGRAPVLVALALIELHGMDPVEAVSFLRQKRRGAINEKQLLYLEGYKKQYKRQRGGAGGGAATESCCVIL